MQFFCDVEPVFRRAELLIKRCWTVPRVYSGNAYLDYGFYIACLLDVQEKTEGHGHLPHWIYESSNINFSKRLDSIPPWNHV